jgi:Flp pilus assembly protein TadG
MTRGSFLRDESGASMVEFAIVLPVLCLFIFGAIDFGRGLKVYNNLAAAARDGARYGATLDDPTTAASKLAIVARTQNSFQNSMGMTLPAAKVQVGTDAGPTYVRVDIANYQYVPLTPIPGGEALTFNLRAQFRWEHVWD